MYVRTGAVFGLLGGALGCGASKVDTSARIEYPTLYIVNLGGVQELMNNGAIRRSRFTSENLPDYAFTKLTKFVYIESDIGYILSFDAESFRPKTILWSFGQQKSIQILEDQWTLPYKGELATIKRASSGWTFGQGKEERTFAVPMDRELISVDTDGETLAILFEGGFVCKLNSENVEITKIAVEPGKRAFGIFVGLDRNILVGITQGTIMTKHQTQLVTYKMDSKIASIEIPAGVLLRHIAPESLPIDIHKYDPENHP
jgi:hypothetical protein